MSHHTESSHLGIAGKLAKMFIGSKLTPLIVFTSLFLGTFAILVTPREEEPQILVPMVDVIVPFQGASPREVEERITTPVEKLLWGLPDVEYIYSTSMPERGLITVRFKVGTELEPAVLRVHHKLREHMPERPEGVGFPLARSYTIDDVPFLATTLHSPTVSDFKLRKVALDMAAEISEIADISRIEVIGGEPRQIRILPDPEKLSQFNVSLLEYFEPLLTANVEGMVGSTKQNDPEWLVEVGGFFQSTEDLENIVVGIKGGRAVRVKDVATIQDGPAERTRQVLFKTKDRAFENAVTLSFAKRPGTNATDLSHAALEKLEKIKPRFLPADTEITITRDYGETAKEKSNTLIEHLLIATFSVMILIALFLGVRSSLVVGAAVPVTLALTLLLYYLFGYTLNRVTLFALIFSIGILVDDAIVVVENIHRHLHSKELRSKLPLSQIIVNAVSEVGNPTILATFTVIAAILPMAFVGGLMGPYMRPIPVGASVAMIFSLVIAFTISPWAARKTHGSVFKKLEDGRDGEHESGEKSKLDRVYDWVMVNLLNRKSAQWAFLLISLAMFSGIGWLVYGKIVRVKMLPFDNKSEFQVVIDMDEGTPLAQTMETAKAMGMALEKVPEVSNYQIYGGSSAPVNFNGLVRHYFLRQSPHLADIQVNLLPKQERDRQSHDIAKAVRPLVKQVARESGARVKVVEIPPGPPVLSTLVAEVYGPNLDAQIQAAKKVHTFFEETDGVVDVDWTVAHEQDKYRIKIDRRRASLKRVPISRIFQTIAAAMGGAPLGLLHEATYPEPVAIALQLPEDYRTNLETVLKLRIPSNDGSFVALSDLARVEKAKAAQPIHHKNLKRVVYVLGDLAGAEEAPVYAIQKLNEKLETLTTASGDPIQIYTTHQPEVTDELSVKWDGEWHITFEVFRDMGIAFGIVMILIYILVVGWFQSFLVPFIIMMPIPLSLIGIIPGHWMFGAFFTATSMIGFIAGAGIIVRNSIILVDYIELGLERGQDLKTAVIKAGEVRFRPMLLTAAAVVVAAFVILFDPIFQGLAISLMMGEVAATLLSRFAVPLLYFVMVGKRRAKELAPKPTT